MYVSILEVGEPKNVRGSKIVSFFLFVRGSKIVSFFFCYIYVCECVRVCVREYVYECKWVMLTVTMCNITNVLNCITFNSCFIKIMEHISLCCPFNCASNKVLYMYVSILEVGKHENVRGSKIVSFFLFVRGSKIVSFFFLLYMCEWVCESVCAWVCVWV